MTIEWLNLTGRVAIVTGGGANGGNGHAIALELAKAGADVFVTDRDGPGAEATAREIEALGRRAVPFACDNGIPDQILASYVAFDRAFSKLDILVNNVAAGIRKRPENITLDEWQGVMRVILDGTFLFTREAGIRMIRQGKGGSIVNISSIAGSSALGRGNFVYSTAKGGINQF
ncbi:MAG TPA: SDR family oxidoreductase, partial [Chloroflexota bacterium]|nr:SDR family oxidoreductase [Chloroflexota bacterium]